MAGGFLFGGDTGETPESLKRKREFAGQARAAGSSTAPVSGTVEAVARALQADAELVIFHTIYEDEDGNPSSEPLQFSNFSRQVGRSGLLN